MKDVEPPAAHWLKQPLNLALAPTLERALYTGLLILGGAIRFQGLATRPLSSQESIGAWAAWLVAQGLEGRLLSGAAPTDSVLLSTLQWITFWLVGASDGLARLFPALAGSALILSPYFFRARLGRLGALFVAGILAIDPWMIACSGLADSSLLSWVLGLVALSFLDRGARPGLHWAWFALLLLISGHQVWSVLPVLIIFVLVRRPELKIEVPLRISGFRSAPSLTGVLVTMGLLLQGQGLGPISTSLSVWLQQWMVNPGEDASSWSVLDLLAQQPLLILSGGAGLVLLWFNLPTQSTVESRWRLFLTLWVLWGLMPAAAVGPDGRLWALWASDLRSAKSALPQQGRVYLSNLGVGGAGSELALKPWTPESTGTVDRIHPNESKQVERIRSYRIQSQGKSYSIFRGDLHRHTDISLDGGGDGGLRDAYRYARDAAALDFIGITDHDHEVAELYAWWRSQKFADLFQQDNFTAFYSYERGIQFPNGHRNIVFTRRGVPILPILTGERLGLEGAERLFWYVRRHGGASIPHTIATGAGTDWRDHDPEAETLLEIYQGMRDTYEYPGAPRPKTLEPTPTVEEDDTPYRRHGTAWSALDKGYKLGFIASSDHLSTHVSYACLIAESLSREDLMEAIHSRRAYAATDNIILDVSYRGSDGQHLMGSVFSSTSAQCASAPTSRVPAC